MFFVHGHLNERCDVHACLAGVFTARGVLRLAGVLRDVDKLDQDMVRETLHLTLHQFARFAVGARFVLGLMFRILQVACGCLGSCV